jgi:hypothetical protein
VNSRALCRSSSSSSSPGPARSREGNPKPPITKLGTLGGTESKPHPITKQKSIPPSPERPAKVSRRLSFPSTDTATESESESAHAVTSPRTTKPSQATSKMGIIGGRKPPKGSKEKTMSPEPSVETSQSTPPKGKSKLGAIGGRKARTASPPPPPRDDLTASQTASPSPGQGTKETMKDQKVAPQRSSTPPKVEDTMTEAERANMKRTELKRQLDEGPGKKKRRKF